MAKKKGTKYVYWKHPSAKGKYVKARRMRNGKLKIVGVVPASQVPGRKGKR